MKRLLVLIIIGFQFCIYAHSQYNSDVKVETLLKTDTTSIGQKIIYPNFPNEQVSVVKVTIPPGKSTGWHKHTFPVFAYVIQGQLKVETENGKSIQYTKDASFSEVVETYHNGINNGTDDVVLIAFFMGGKGMPLSVHK